MTDFLSFAITHPDIIFRTLMKKGLTDEQRILVSEEIIHLIEKKCKISKNSLSEYHKEFLNENKLLSYLNKSLENLENSGAFNPTFQSVIYALVRYSKPKFIIETGVANGVSSTIILNALEKNNLGTLQSIDLPVEYWENSPYRKIDKVKVKGNNVGWIVPNDIKDRWKLHLGSSKEILPTLLEKIKSCDIFFHDSEHSYDNMMFEFETVWPYITKKGIIIADDINRNKSFEDFILKHKGEVFAIKLTQFGLIFKK